MLSGTYVPYIDQEAEIELCHLCKNNGCYKKYGIDRPFFTASNGRSVGAVLYCDGFYVTLKEKKRRNNESNNKQ